MRAVYLVSHAPVIDRDTLDIGGTRFTSRALSRNLIDQDTVFPFIATVGKELDELSVPAGSLMMQFCLDGIKTLALVSAVDYLAESLKEKYRLGNVAHVNPGEIEDWPITAQKPFFGLFDGAETVVGVTFDCRRPYETHQVTIRYPVSQRQALRELPPLHPTAMSSRRAPYTPEKVKEYLD